MIGGLDARLESGPLFFSRDSCCITLNDFIFMRLPFGLGSAPVGAVPLPVEVALRWPSGVPVVALSLSLQSLRSIFHFSKKSDIIFGENHDPFALVREGLKVHQCGETA